MNMLLPGLSLHDESLLLDPYPIYSLYRENDPVHWGMPYTSGSSGCWYLFRHDHVLGLLKDRRFLRKGSPAAHTARLKNAPISHRPFLAVFDKLLLSTDPPDHRRLRMLVNKAFTPETIESHRLFIQKTTNELIDALPASRQFDVVEDFAAPLSFTVICTILGVPLKDVQALRKWAEQFANGFDLRKGEAAMFEASEGTVNLSCYFSEIFLKRRKRPCSDLISLLIAARDNGDRLSEDELLAMCIQIMFAGYETTVSQIGETIFSLLENRDQLELLRASPDLIRGVITESARLNGAVQTAAPRKSIEDVKIGDKLIKAGESVIAFIGAANRDPAIFIDPDRFQPHRINTQSLAFGGGIHHCLGVILARIESEIAVNTLIQRLPHLQLQKNMPLKRRMNIVLPGFVQLMVKA